MNNRFNYSIIFYIFVAYMLISAFTSWSQEKLFATLLTLPGLVLAITVHEYAHAKTSDRYGDPTPERQGRLTLNPLAHLDPIGTFCLIFAHFGWGKPVEIDPTYYRNPAKESMKVAAAGPISNFILCIILFVIYGVMAFLALAGYVSQSEVFDLAIYMVFYAAEINLALGLFNLLPFPPLDGSKIFGYFLKGKAKEVLWTLERYSYIILIILFATGLPALILEPIMNFIENGILTILSSIISLAL